MLATSTDYELSFKSAYLKFVNDNDKDKDKEK